MDEGTRLALQAIIQGLRRSGAIGDHCLAVIIDELRYASRQARAALYDRDGNQIDHLANDLQKREGFDIAVLSSTRGLAGVGHGIAAAQ